METDTPESSSSPVREDESYPGSRRSSGCTLEDFFPAITDNGRLYQSFRPEQYILPIDGQEQDRQDFQHAFWRTLLDDRLGLVELQRDPENVLDIGIGTGIWAIEFAGSHRASRVFGTDLCAIQPHLHTENLTWVIEDSEKQPWAYFEPFDYIHLRSIGPCFEDFSVILKKCFNHTKPGAWIELQDGALELKCDDGTAENTSLPDFFIQLNIGAKNLGRDLLKAKDFETYLRDAGFEDIMAGQYAVPGSPWCRDGKMNRCADYLRRSIHIATDSYQKFFGAAGLSAEASSALIKRVKEDLRRVDIHWYMPFFIVAARKPVRQWQTLSLNNCLSEEEGN